MLTTSPPVISPRETAEAAISIVGQQASGWSTAGEVATVVAGVAAALGLAFTGYEMRRANRRERAHEQGRAQRVGVSCTWPSEGSFIKNGFGHSGAIWGMRVDVDILNGNDTSITNVEVGWRAKRAGAIDASATAPVSVLLPQARPQSMPRLSLRINVDRLPAPLNGYQDLWSVVTERHPETGGMYTPGQERWNEVVKGVQSLGQIFVRWELDGYLWERVDGAGVRRLGTAAS